MIEFFSFFTNVEMSIFFFCYFIKLLILFWFNFFELFFINPASKIFYYFVIILCSINFLGLDGFNWNLDVFNSIESV